MKGWSFFISVCSTLREKQVDGGGEGKSSLYNIVWEGYFIRKVAEQGERAILVSVAIGHGQEPRADELRELAIAAGAIVVGSVNQSRNRPDPALFIGKGKAEQLARLARTLQASLIIFDVELSPIQLTNLMEVLETKVVDRTQLILDIFAQRARSREGKVQVELAQLTYLLPRLRGRGTEFSRLGGGIGTRGPGETKLEIDRRRIRKRIRDLKLELEEIRQRRSEQRRTRRRAHYPTVALCGYTNAGKTSLLNSLTGCDALAEDMPFATLDPVTRKASTPTGFELLLTDTVGFIRNLPHDLVAAFRATLEEATEADLLLHVVDVTSPDTEEQIEVSRKVLWDLGVSDGRIVTVFNKIDALRVPGKLSRLLRLYEPSVAVSAVTGAGLPKLLEVIEARLRGCVRRELYHLPYHHLHLLPLLHAHGRVLKEEYLEQGLLVEAELDTGDAQRIRKMLTQEA